MCAYIWTAARMVLGGQCASWIEKVEDMCSEERRSLCVGFVSASRKYRRFRMWSDREKEEKLVKAGRKRIRDPRSQEHIEAFLKTPYGQSPPGGAEHMPSTHLEYRAPGGGAWRASNNVNKDFNKRKKYASIERTVEALLVETPTTEWDMHINLLPLFKPRYQTYKSRTTSPRIEEIKAELGADGQARLRTTFGQLVDSLKMTGKSRSWQLQEEGKIPIFGTFAFHMRLLEIDISPGNCLPEGALEKRTCEGEVVDPVKRGVPLQPSMETNRLRYLVIWKTDVFCIGAMNARERDGEDALVNVVKSWLEFEHLESWRPLAIFDSSGRDAYAFAFETTREDFEAKRCVGGPARTLRQLEECLSLRPEWEQPVGLPTATISDFLEVFLGSMVVCPPRPARCQLQPLRQYGGGNHRDAPRGKRQTVHALLENVREGAGARGGRGGHKARPHEPRHGDHLPLR